MVDLRILKDGERVRVAGVLRASGSAPTGPVSERALVGWTVLCSVFGDGGFLARLDASSWPDALLDGDGEALRVHFGDRAPKVPATAERTLSEAEDVARALERLGLEHAGAEALQLLERGIPDGARVWVEATVATLRRDAGGAFRASARPPKGLVSPIVIRPRT